MDSSFEHSKYMKRCLELARKGLGNTGTNPLVGSVIVHNDRIIGEGYHCKFGGPHAEVNAINAVKNQELLKNSTLYVNLEPCSHFGKTPPCSLLIKDKEIPEVVVGMTDPNPSVLGSGIEALRQSGVKVTTGILEDECRFLNRRFIINQEEKRPYVILKWAESSDGFIDKVRKKGDPLRPNWITNHTARMLVHKWRSEEDGITAGVNTILTDNPSLNLRDWTGKDPVRIIIDRFGRIPANFNVKDNSSPTWIFSNMKNGIIGDNTRIFKISAKYELSDLLNKLYKEGISSVIVEGGADFTNSFINNDLWDEARVFTGKEKFIEGVKAPKIEKKSNFFHVFRNNKLRIWVKGIT
ncbi:MAG: bifunctional diaminohydroxyphosphoribosylaminopyrimidine deaminase/5-amino-6-(5-phosphoribosylamino)uracil reductase RibD [Bacteroidales bacterium]